MTRAVGFTLSSWLITLWLAVSPCLGQVQSTQPASAQPAHMEQMPPPRPEAPSLELRPPAAQQPRGRDAAYPQLGPSPLPKGAGLMEELRAAERQSSDRIRRIQDKLDRLKRLMKACETGDPPQLRQPKPKEAPTPAPVIEDDGQHPAIDTTAEIVFRTPEPTPSKPPPAAPPITAPPIQMTSTVDRLALANNLFAQGKADLALPMYEELLKMPQQPKDRIWIEYQLAACYRMQGEIAKATQLYHNLAGSKEHEYWQARALWWLDYLSKTTEIVKQHQQLESELDSLRKATNELSTP